MSKTLNIRLTDTDRVQYELACTRNYRLDNSVHSCSSSQDA
jgi:hypothetical protein